MAGITIGVDVGGTTVAAGLVGPDGQVLEHAQAPTHARGEGRALDTILDLLARLQDSARARGVTVTGVGVGVPGVVESDRGTIGAEIHHVPELAGVPIRERLAQPLGLPVFVDNDVNVLALAEWMWGAGRGARSLVMLALGTGVGGGIILDGRLHRGHAGFGGELGHVPVQFDGPPCICGGRGCLKAYVSGTDIARRGSERLGRPVTAAEIFRLAAAGDPDADAAVDEVCRALGAGLGIIVNGLNPERVLLAGSVAKSLRPLEARLRASLARHSFEGARASTHLEILSLDKAATVRGGAALVHYEIQGETHHDDVRRRTTTS
ncbi:MAG TPA: ROK family protein [Methylomirabilota bacterium]|nr:ROK family protein [Methylomirabilota bacterium]